MRDDLYMITCAARTGSSLLETSLMSHPDIMSHGEIYAPNRIGALRGRYSRYSREEDICRAMTKYRDANQTAFLYKYVYDAQGRKAVGHKFKHEELMLPKFAETREAIRRDTDIKIIHLRRHNLLERFVSWWVVRHVTGVTEIHSEESRPEITAVEVPLRACQESFDETTARYDFARKLFADHPSYEVVYEDLVGPEGEKVMTEIQKFLGVTPQPLTSRLKKVVTKDMRSVIANFDELKSHFATTPYAEFFEEKGR